MINCNHFFFVLFMLPRYHILFIKVQTIALITLLYAESGLVIITALMAVIIYDLLMFKKKLLLISFFPIFPPFFPPERISHTMPRRKSHFVNWRLRLRSCLSLMYAQLFNLFSQNSKYTSLVIRKMNSQFGDNKDPWMNLHEWKLDWR